MKINLQQNSFAWFQHRKNFINASEIGTIMSLNPYETKEGLIKKKLFKPTFTSNEAIEHGKKTEPKANLFFSVLTKRNYEPAVFTKGIFSASLDGYHEESKTMLEIKCPLNKGNSWKDFFEKKLIPPYYWAQIQCGLYCAEIEKAYFFVYFNHQEYYLETVKKDEEFISRMEKEGLKFQKLLETYQKMFQKKEGILKND